MLSSNPGRSMARQYCLISKSVARELAEDSGESELLISRFAGNLKRFGFGQSSAALLSFKACSVNWFSKYNSSSFPIFGIIHLLSIFH